MRDFGEVAERLRRSTVHVHNGGRQGSGSGVIWSSDTVLTNAHVARESRLDVELWDGSVASATVAARDPRRDLAQLKLNAGSMPVAMPGDSGALRPGELVIAVGNPLGFSGAVSTGVVHAVGPLAPFGRREWVQANVRLAPGNSGGPLADAQGRVIGINTMIAGGLALAVPSNTVARFLREGPGPSLGVTVRPVPAGLLVLEVAPDSPAASASMLVGDLLVGANDRPFRSANDLSDAIEDSAGGVLRLDFVRGDRRARRAVAVRLARGLAEAA